MYQASGAGPQAGDAPNGGPTGGEAKQGGSANDVSDVEFEEVDDNKK
jgi:hypothetical protein